MFEHRGIEVDHERVPPVLAQGLRVIARTASDVDELATGRARKSVSQWV
jgi:hypothetical protein